MGAAGLGKVGWECRLSRPSPLDLDQASINSSESVALAPFPSTVLNGQKDRATFAKR